MFKRPRLRSTSHLVNASFALALLFLAPSCGKSDQNPENIEGGHSEPAISQSEGADISLPAVWNTSPLSGPVKSLGIAGMLGSTIAVGYEDGGLQLFSFDGDRITDKADLGVAGLADGRFVMLSGAPMTIFPGIASDGGLYAYVHGGDLPAPIPLDLATSEHGTAIGLCSAPPSVEADGMLRLAFWTREAPQKLHSGRLVEVGENLVYLLDEPVIADQDISACILEETGATVYSAPAQNVVVLERNGQRHTLTLDTSGNFALLGADGTSEPVTIRDGLSVKMPQVPSAMAGTGDARGGGYTGGILVVTGEVSDGDHRAVLIDPSEITMPLGLTLPSLKD